MIALGHMRYSNDFEFDWLTHPLPRVVLTVSNNL